MLVLVSDIAVDGSSWHAMHGRHTKVVRSLQVMVLQNANNIQVVDCCPT